MKKYVELLKVWSLLCVFVLACLSPIIIWVFISYMEASAYNRVTKSDVTTWEAMWVELRVQSDSK